MSYLRWRSIPPLLKPVDPVVIINDAIAIAMVIIKFSLAAYKGEVNIPLQLQEAPKLLK